MNSKLKLFSILGALALAASASAIPQNNGVTVAVVLEQPRQDIPDFSLLERLNDRLALRGGYDVVIPGRDSAVTQPPIGTFDLRRLVAWGEPGGCRYIIYVQIENRRIAVRKQSSIPCLLSRYVVEGNLVGVFSLVDVKRAKIVNTWDLGTTVTGARQWQPFEDYPDDPDLHIPAPQKIILLHKLEEKAVTTIYETVSSHLKAR